MEMVPREGCHRAQGIEGQGLFGVRFDVLEHACEPVLVALDRGWKFLAFGHAADITRPPRPIPDASCFSPASSRKVCPAAASPASRDGRVKYFPVVWAGLWRRPARSVFTLLSVAVAFFLFGMLQGLNDGFDKAIADQHLDRLITDTRCLARRRCPFLHLRRSKHSRRHAGGATRDTYRILAPTEEHGGRTRHRPAALLCRAAGVRDLAATVRCAAEYARGFDRHARAHAATRLESGRQDIAEVGNAAARRQ